MKSNKGYTLIELVVVVGLTALLTIAISAIMMSSLLSSNRVRTVVDARQSGSYAISQMEKMIRGAKSFDPSACTPNSITFTNFDGGSTTFALDSNRIASNSAFLTPDTLRVTSFAITCEPSGNPQLVKISFTLENVTTSTRPSDNVSIEFETSVRPRNYR